MDNVLIQNVNYETHDDNESENSSIQQIVTLPNKNYQTTTKP